MKGKHFVMLFPALDNCATPACCSVPKFLNPVNSPFCSWASASGNCAARPSAACPTAARPTAAQPGTVVAAQLPLETKTLAFTPRNRLQWHSFAV